MRWLSKRLKRRDALEGSWPENDVDRGITGEGVLEICAVIACTQVGAYHMQTNSELLLFPRFMLTGL